jgi:hypothetical protein
MRSIKTRSAAIIGKGGGWWLISLHAPVRDADSVITSSSVKMLSIESHWTIRSNLVKRSEMDGTEIDRERKSNRVGCAGSGGLRYAIRANTKLAAAKAISGFILRFLSGPFGITRILAKRPSPKMRSRTGVPEPARDGHPPLLSRNRLPSGRQGRRRAYTLRVITPISSG